MRHFSEVGLLVLVFIGLVASNYQESFPEVKKNPDMVSRAISSISSSFNLGIETKFRKLDDIPERAGVDTTEHIFNKEVVVAIIDTGINLDDQWLMKSVYRIKNIPQIYDLTEVTKDGSDINGHGTILASIILSINPNAKIVPIKCITGGSADAVGSFSAGIRLARTTPGVSIINLSGGGKEYDKEEEVEILKAINAGILVVAASGNNGQDLNKHKFYPASLGIESGMITVANLLKNGSLSMSSNFGTNVIDVAITGTDLPGFNHNGDVVSKSGSSQSAAMISGIASLIKGIRPDYKSNDIKAAIIKTASIFPKVKHGRVNTARALNFARNDSDKLTNLKTKVVSLNTHMKLK